MAAVSLSAATSRRRVPDTASMCVVGSMTGTHDFLVNDYSLLAGHVGRGRSVTSTTFTVGGYDWAIKFYPDGNHVWPPSMTSVFLHLLRTKLAPARGVIAKFNITLVDRDGKESYFSRATTRTFGQINCWGWVRFYWKPFLRWSRCLVDDRLTIRCVVTVISPLPAEHYTPPPEVPPPELPGHLDRALQDMRGADVTFDVCGRTFSAHRFMLAARSPVFEAELFGPMLERDMELIRIADMEPDIFEMLLHYVYTDSLPPCGSGGDHDFPAMQHLLVAADRYGLDRMKIICEQKLCKSIDKKNILSMFMLADHHHSNQLRDACFSFMIAKS